MKPFLDHLNRRRFVAAAAALGAAPSYSVSPWPSKPIRIVVPFTTGGSLDILIRAIGQQLSKSLKQPVIIENKSGAGGVIGTNEVAKAAPDGYTLVTGTIGTHVVNPLVVKNLPYDAVKDFTPVSLIQFVPLVLAVNPGLGVNTFQEFIALARAKDESISLASPSNAHLLAIVRLGQMSGVKFRIVPYRGPAQSIPDAVGGHISGVLDTGMAVLPQVKAGGLKMLAIGSKRRLPMFDGVPTIMEAGLPGYEVSGVNSLYAPAGLPAPILDILSREIRRIVSSPDIANLIINNAGIVANSSPEELSKWQVNETEVWRSTIAKGNLKFE